MHTPNKLTIYMYIAHTCVHVRTKINTLAVMVTYGYSFVLSCAQDWTDLEKETNECQKAMQDELDRFVSLDD